MIQTSVFIHSHFTVTTQTAAMTAALRMPWTQPRPSASSRWGWVKYICRNTTTTTTATTETTTTETPSPTPTAPPPPPASPTRCRPGWVCALTSRRGASPSTTPTPCARCGRGTSTAPGLSAPPSASSAAGRCSCRSWSPTETRIRRR